MHESPGVEGMPQSVKLARVLLWIEFALGVLGLVLVAIAVSQLADDAQLEVAGITGGIVWVLGYSFALVALVLASALALKSRKSWVRIAVLVLHGILLVLEVIGLFSGITLGVVARIAILAGIVVSLSREEARVWFDR
ncbi:hypothetical protein [Sinosporangium siamense]|uniref:Uncharacterized protein n=1 Tax=Sinosporangium siamense TaxID=1367973 RepID=A0A919RMQ5_9ACTN|nr:hypothetical protein [Sinosporangium siamense]GII96621.1 hypothetical protein Ssi02_68520 [Sinosporangium siamense]